MELEAKLALRLSLAIATIYSVVAVALVVHKLFF